MDERLLTEASILTFLRAIEQGDITLTPEIPPHEVNAGVVSYAASNGWRIAIFNDCDEWDYIEWIEAGEERITYDEIVDTMPAVAQYEPDDDTGARAYGIPWTSPSEP